MTKPVGVRKEMNNQTVWGILPTEILSRLRATNDDIMGRIEEIRLRIGQPLQLFGTGLDAYLSDVGGITSRVEDALLVTPEFVTRVMQLATQASMYAVEEELRRGYVTVPGGHRIGVAGRAALSDTGSVKSIRAISSINIRVAREWLGSADGLRPFVAHRADSHPLSVLLLSPPGCGKTTMLRDLARQWSDGEIGKAQRAYKVTIVDERAEIAGCVDGLPQFQIGHRTDVLDGCPKAQGMMMAIRSLSPEILVTDEIGRQSDVEAILEALNAGVAVIASAHADSVASWRKRPFMDTLFASRSFERFVSLSRRRGPCTVERVFDAEGSPLASFGQMGKGDWP